jgi:hypothetical protein
MTAYKFLVGAVLTFAMVSVLTLAALAFSARDFQYGVWQVSQGTGGLVDFDRLEQANQEIDRIQAESSGSRSELDDITNEIAAIDAQARAASASAEEARTAIVRQIAEVETSANIVAASAASDMSADALSNRVGALASRSGLSPEDQQTVAEAQALLQRLAGYEEGLLEFDRQRLELVARQRLVSGQVDEAERRQSAWRVTVIRDTDQYARIRAEAAALDSGSPFGVSRTLAEVHPALLSTIVVLLMGALGSLLYLFPAYLNRPLPVTNAEIAVRLIFGMCAAFAFYLLANAAVAGFSIGASTTDALSTSTALNPFTVSLIGIVAGVLSEDIAKWIQDRGRNILTQGGGGGETVAPAAPVQSERAAGGGLVNNNAL